MGNSFCCKITTPDPYNPWPKTVKGNPSFHRAENHEAYPTKGFYFPSMWNVYWKENQHKAQFFNQILNYIHFQFNLILCCCNYIHNNKLWLHSFYKHFEPNRSKEVRLQWLNVIKDQLHEKRKKSEKKFSTFTIG